MLLDGRWFSQIGKRYEKRTSASSARPSSKVIFPLARPIGQTLEIGGSEFRVIGVLEKREQLFGGGGGNNDQSNIIYMPMGAALKLKPNADDLFILAVAREGMLQQAQGPGAGFTADSPPGSFR